MPRQPERPAGDAAPDQPLTPQGDQAADDDQGGKETIPDEAPDEDSG